VVFEDGEERSEPVVSNAWAPTTKLAETIAAAKAVLSFMCNAPLRINFAGFD
jgi:hypothetical protein